MGVKIKKFSYFILFSCIFLVWIAGFVGAAKFSIGDKVEVYNTGASGLKVRYPNACSSSYVLKYDGARGTVLEGPFFCDGYNRWKIRWSDEVLEGWSADGLPAEEWLKKVSIPPSTKFSIGNRVKVNADGVNVRGDPPELAALGSVNYGDQGTVISGPFYGVPKGSSGFYYFWKIDYDTKTDGWTAENYLDRDSCTNECSSGQTRCNGNYQQTCGNYDADSCLEWPSSTSGSGNEYCSYGCSNGVCNSQTCTPNSKRCNGNILETCKSDGSGWTVTQNCGTSSYCSSDSCSSCSSGTANCNQNSADACEINLNNDNNNCGSCGNVCTSGQTCQNGVCSIGGCGPSLFPELFHYSSQNNQNLYNAFSSISQELKIQNIALTPELLAAIMATLEKEVGGSGFLPVEEGGDYGMGPGCTYKIGGVCRSTPYEGGVDYKGRGYIQITHKSNYQEHCGADCIGTSTPELDVCGCKNQWHCTVTDKNICPQIKALQPEKAGKIFVSYYQKRFYNGKNLITLSNEKNYWQVGYLINGGSSYADDFKVKADSYFNLFNTNQVKTQNLISCLSGIDNFPVVNLFSVSPSSTILGNAFTISYSVSDDVGLIRAELWRANDSNGQQVSWNETTRTSISGKSYSGSFSDTPVSAGVYWYGLHVADSSGKWNDERNSWTGGLPSVYGPIKVNVCVNECSSGQTRCSGTYKQTCGNYDADACLEWPSSTSGNGNELCPAGCSNNACIVTCTKNSDCGTDGYVGNPSCSNNDVFQNWRTWTCNNAETPQSSCSYTDTSKLKQDCGTKDCDINNYHFIDGTNSPTATSYCKYRDYEDCDRPCYSAACQDCSCNAYSDSTQNTAGICRYIDGCSGSTPGTVKNYPKGTSCGTDKECNGEGNCELILKSYILSLNKGWNLISFPLNLTDKLIKNVFNGINFRSIFSYGSWNYYFNDTHKNFNTINESKGYWVNSLSNQILTIEGNKFGNVTFNLNKGWHLIGYQSLNETNISKLFKNATIYMYNNSKWYSYDSNKPPKLNTLNKFIPGYGYWVKK